MNGERRAAPRHFVPPDVAVDVSGIAARLLELSLVGAKVEHHEPFSLTSPRVTLTWRGNEATVTARAARSEVVARHVYHTGLHFEDLNSISRGFISSILNDPASELTANAPPLDDADEAPEAPSLDDTWMRKVQRLKHDLDEDFPFAQFRLTATGWRKEYVTSPAQPDDGFTLPRERADFAELQKAYEAADAETRRMMRIALESLTPERQPRDGRS